MCFSHPVSLWVSDPLVKSGMRHVLAHNRPMQSSICIWIPVDDIHINNIPNSRLHQNHKTTSLQSLVKKIYPSLPSYGHNLDLGRVCTVCFKNIWMFLLPPMWLDLRVKPNRRWASFLFLKERFLHWNQILMDPSLTFFIWMQNMTTLLDVYTLSGAPWEEGNLRRYWWVSEGMN